jgi:hypothetical protein
MYAGNFGNTIWTGAVVAGAVAVVVGTHMSCTPAALAVPMVSVIASGVPDTVIMKVGTYGPISSPTPRGETQLSSGTVNRNVRPIHTLGSGGIALPVGAVFVGMVLSPSSAGLQASGDELMTRAMAATRERIFIGLAKKSETVGNSRRTALALAHHCPSFLTTAPTEREAGGTLTQR